MVSRIGKAGVEQCGQLGLTDAASAALANRCSTAPVRDLPSSSRARVACWWCWSGERRWRNGARPAVGLHSVSGQVVE